VTTLLLVARLIRRRWFLFTLNILLHVMRMSVMLVPALVIRSYLDILTGQVPADWSYGTWVLILVASQVGRYINGFAHAAADTTLVYDLGGYLRQNLVREILRRPGADTLVVVSGQTISRLRDDVEEVTNLVKRIDDVAGRIVFCVSAVAIMAAISGRITLLVIGPMFLLSMLVYLCGRCFGCGACR
jgi:ATP-binding cassette subfamily B protein